MTGSKSRKPELLVPASSLEVLKTAEIFGADAALYIEVKDYGTTYTVLSSDSVVTLDAKLVGLPSGQVLWSGHARASSAEQQSNSNGLIGQMVSALINQVLDTINDRSYSIAGIADRRLLTASQPNGLLYGPRSPKYGTD